MNSAQYEELCRLFLARKFAVPLETIISTRISNSQRPGLEAYQHQIDLFWEVTNEVARYVHIANAKWRASEKIDQGDILLLNQVRTDLSAHKAVLIASTGFTAGAIQVAQHHGIALHVVHPTFAADALPTHDRAAMQASLVSLEARGPVCTNEVVHRALDPELRPGQPEAPSPLHGSAAGPIYTTRLGGGMTRQGAPPTSRGTPPTGPGGGRAGGAGPGFTRGGGSSRGGRR